MLGERHLVHLKKIQAMQSKINSLQIKYELLHRKKRKEKKNSNPLNKFKYFQLSTAGLQVLRYHTSRNTTLNFKTKKMEMKHFYSAVCLLLQLDFNKGKGHSVKPHLHANTPRFSYLS